MRLWFSRAASVVLGATFVAVVAVGGCQPQPIAQPLPVVAAAPAPSAEPRATTPTIGPWQERAAAYLDKRSALWLDNPPATGSNFPCSVSCHTTHAFALARRHLGADSIVDKRVLDAVIARVRSVEDWRQAQPMYGEPDSDKERESRGTEAVLHASVLAFAPASMPDRQGLIDKSFRHMWATQREDGAWAWLNFELQPMEADNEDWGAALAALAVGRAGKIEQADPLKGYLQQRLASGQMRLHAQIMLLWASSQWPAVIDPSQRDSIIRDVVAAQLDDGGWSVAALGFSSSPSAEPQRADGYASAISTLALCSSARTKPVERGLAWLTKHQRVGGSWPGYSLNGDSPRAHGYMSDAATAYAVLALTQCR